MTDDSDSRSAPWIDRGHGSGARGFNTDKNASVITQWDNANDGRSATETTFYWTAADTDSSYLRSRDRHQLHRDPDDRRSWGELAQWNDGKGSPTRDMDNYNADISRWIQTFCGQLPVNSYHQDRTAFIVDALDLTDFGPIPVEHIILAVITLVVDIDSDIDPATWSVDDWIVHQDVFESLMDDVSMDKGRLWDLRKKIHHETDVFDETGGFTY
jgi:hypothetical protein